MNSEDDIDSMFVKLPITQIKHISREYHDKIQQTKQDLHKLVGDKYRDLIKIAEDIDSMYETSDVTHQQITNLSYETSKFTSFDNCCKFDTLIRGNAAYLSRLNSRAIIVRNILNKKLTKLDNKICQGQMPLVHTSNFIYYAKVFYTIEQTFGDVLQGNKSIYGQFVDMKSNLIRYLESELAWYNLSDSIVHSNNNDKFKLNQRLTLKDVTSSTEEEEDTVDDIDEEDLEHLDKFENYEFVNSKIESYDTHVLPIVNYLLSLTILYNSTFDDVVRKFIDIRFKYLESLLVDSSINWFKIFKYIENTICYYTNYFANTKTSDYYLGLKSVVGSSWRASSLIGHRSWFDDSVIKFNLDRDLPVTTCLIQFPTVVFDFITEKLSQLDTSPSILTYHKIMLSLVKLQDSIELSGTNSYLINMIISSTSLLRDLLSQIITKIKHSFDTHISLLNTNILDTIKQQPTENTQHKMFSQELGDIMDDNIDKYMKIITDTVVMSSVQDSGGLVYSWFDEYTKYIQIVSIKEEIGKLDGVVNCISHLHQSFKHLNWQCEFVKLFDDEFNKLQKMMNDSLWRQVDMFVDSLAGLISDQVEDNFYLIGIIGRLKEKLDVNRDIWEKIDKLCIELFESIVENITSEEFTDLFGQAIEEQEEQEEQEDLPVFRPSLKMISAMYVLAKEYSKYDNTGVIIIDWMKSNFTNIKNNWMKEKLISQLVQAHQESQDITFAVNYIFLLEFTSTTIDKSELTQFVSIEDSKLDMIIQGVNSYYKSNKNIYLPLSL
ncbi:hypothetical protein JA1_003073 [Spathaspora sp. JA1]|nr:hypothetical protein JA1_003073 [Spathaspora sp. JA1]